MKASVSIISACLLFMALLCNPESLHEQCQDKFLFSLEFKCWLCCHLSLLPGHADARCNEKSLTMTNKQTDRRGSELSPRAALLIKIFACNLCQRRVGGPTISPFLFMPDVCAPGKLRRQTQRAALTRPN